jgi:hypothetical protein
MKKILQVDIDEILSGMFWPEHLKTNKSYVVTHDDNDGDSESGFMNVIFSADGDAWISVNCKKMLRYRMPFDGGGKYPKVRNALLLLAEAIRQENGD